MDRKSARQTIRRLHEVRNHYGAEAAKEKLGLLELIGGLPVRSAADLRRLHLCLCFLRAFPDSRDIYDRTCALLDGFESLVTALSDRQRDTLADSGIAGTRVHYAFSCEVASWMARCFPGIASVDWDELEDTGRLDELLELLVLHAEADYFDSGQVDSEEWIRIAAGNRPGTDLDWLIAELDDRHEHRRFWTSLYNAAEIPLRCELAEAPISRTANVFPVDSICFRRDAMQSRVRHPKQAIASPLRTISRLGKRDGARLIDVAMSSLAARHRETIHFNYANPDEVYLADVGRGVAIAVTGLLPEERYPVECTMGFLILSNGVPIGYGGSSLLFRQANTGINIFEEYRGSEAAWLWVQVMRVFHTLSGCTRFIANPYQFGSENPEALRSGAFWFYYRLGYRPVEQDIRQLARNEFDKLRKSRAHRTPYAVLRRLATCDMHLTLPGARRSEFFDEAWIEAASLLVTRQLAATGRPSGRTALNEIAQRLAAGLDLDSQRDWSRDERQWFLRLGPLVAAAEPANWPARERRSMAALMRAKGGRCEIDFVRQFRKHLPFFTALKHACRDASRARTTTNR